MDTTSINMFWLFCVMFQIMGSDRMKLETVYSYILDFILDKIITN